MTMIDRTNYFAKPCENRTDKNGPRIDGGIIKFWAKKPAALAAAKALGLSPKDVKIVHTRFQVGYAICNPHFMDQGGFYTHFGYEQAMARLGVAA